MKQRHSVTDGWNRFPRVEQLWLPGEGESGKILAGHLIVGVAAIPP